MSEQHPGRTLAGSRADVEPPPLAPAAADAQASGSAGTSAPGVTTPVSPVWARAGLALAVLVIAVIPLVITSRYWAFLTAEVGIFLLIAFGLNLLSGYAGQTSLGQGALVAVGTYTLAILTVDHGWGFWPATVAAVVVSVVAGSLMALPALRLSAWYFALITLGFAVVTEEMLVQWVPLTHGFSGLIGVPMPSFGGSPLGPREFLWLVLAIDLLAFLLVRNVVRSRLGRSLIAVREGGTAALASGVSVVGTKLFAFMISAGLAGLGGALLAAQQTVITPDIFTVDFSVFFLVAVVLGGAGRLWGPVVGCVVFFTVPELLSELATWRLLVYGIVLIALMVFAPNGIVGGVGQLAARLRPRLPARWTAGRTVVAQPPPTAWESGGRGGAELAVEHLRMTFGGVVAVDDVSLEVPVGTVQAVVGPNGSGKTTLLNMISGYYRPTGGSVRIGNRNVVGSSPPAIARMGLGRTFQTPRLLPDLSLIENVLLGACPRERATGLEVALRLPRARREARAIRDEALASLAFVGLADHAELPAGEVPHGQQRLAEIARSLVGRPRILLLDEPAAGLSLRELDLLGELIGEIRRRGITVVLVEHHIDLITDICDRVLVLDRGAALTQGTPSEVFSHPEVITAYTGAHTGATR